MEKRWIQMDVARGLGILLIVFGHSWFVASSPDFLYLIIASFVLSLFFAISGVFFKPEQPFIEMLLRKADGLLKPYFATMLTYVIIRSILRHQPLLPDVGGVFYATVDTIPWQALWFLPHFWLSMVFSWVMLRLMHRFGLSLTVCCIVLAAQLLLGVWTVDWFWQVPVTIAGQNYVLPGLPFSLDVVLITSVYLMLGYLLRKILRQHQSNLLTLIIATVLFSAVFAYTWGTIDLAQRRYDSWFWTTIMALSGSYVCWALSGLIIGWRGLSTVMTYIGQSTLILLIFHGEIQHKAFDLLVHLGLPEFGAACVAMVIAVVVPLLIGEVIKRVGVLRALYFPFPVRKQPPAVAQTR